MKKRLFLFSFLFLFLTSLSFSAWLSGYGYRKKITIQGTLLDGNVTHFPLLIYIVDADIDDHCDDDGTGSWDIMFTQSDGSTELDIDWLDYSEAGGNATIICYVSDAGWGIESDGSTYIYLYYGNAAAGDPGTRAGVYDANYVAIYHLDESGNGTNDEFVDSTGTGNDGTGGGQSGAGDGNATPDQVTGKIHKGNDWVLGNSDRIGIGSDTSIDDLGACTFSFWIEPDDDTWGRIFGKLRTSIGQNDTNNQLYLKVEHATTALITISNNALIPIDTMTHVAITWDGSTASANVIFYQNGAVHGNASEQDGVGGRTTDAGSNALLGSKYDESSNFDGTLDEFRISDSVRAVAWIKFSHANMNEGDNELSWEAEEAAPSGFIPRVIIIK